jgi:hypothetical protein
LQNVLNTTFEALNEKKVELEEDKTRLEELQKRANQLEREKENIERSKSHLEIMVSTLKEPNLFRESDYKGKDSLSEEQKYFEMIDDLKRQYDENAKKLALALKEKEELRMYLLNLYSATTLRLQYYLL